MRVTNTEWNTVRQWIVRCLSVGRSVPVSCEAHLLDFLARHGTADILLVGKDEQARAHQSL